MSHYKEFLVASTNNNISFFANHPCLENCTRHCYSCYEIADIEYLKTEQIQNMYVDLIELMTYYYDDNDPLFCLSEVDYPITYQLIVSADFEDKISENKKLTIRRKIVLSQLYSKILSKFFPNLHRLTESQYIEWAIDKNIYLEDFEYFLQTKIIYTQSELIYFVGSNNPLTIKIGYTTQLQKRIKSLQTGFPRKLIVYGVIRGSQTIEKKLHLLFKHRKTHGEWFYLDEELKQFILGLKYPEHDFPYLYHYNLMNDIEKAKKILKKHRIPY